MRWLRTLFYLSLGLLPASAPLPAVNAVLDPGRMALLLTFLAGLAAAIFVVPRRGRLAFAFAVLLLLVVGATVQLPVAMASLTSTQVAAEVRASLAVILWGPIACVAVYAVECARAARRPPPEVA